MDGGGILKPRTNEEAPEPRFRLGGFQRVSHYTLWSWGVGAGIAPIGVQLLSVSYIIAYFLHGKLSFIFKLQIYSKKLFQKINEIY